MAKPLIIGHRGASAAAPENTLAAFRLAIEAGADGVEFDVRLARDGVPVVLHDRTLKRTAGITSDAASLTSAELGAIDVGNWFDATKKKNSSGRFGGETVPTLAKTLEELRSLCGPIFIELKCDDDDCGLLTASVCEVLKYSPPLPNVIIKSFRPSVIERAKYHLPHIRTAALFSPKIMTILRKEKHLVRIAGELGADELSIHYSLATRKLMDEATERGLPVNIWTANHPRWVKKALKLGISCLITDDPAKLLVKRREIQAAVQAG